MGFENLVFLLWFVEGKGAVVDTDVNVDVELDLDRF